MWFQVSWVTHSLPISRISIDLQGFRANFKILMTLIKEDLTVLEFTFFTFAIHEFFFFFFAISYNVIDHWGAFQKSKIQTAVREKDQPKKIYWVITLGFNHLFLQLPGLYGIYFPYKTAGIQFSGPLPSYSTILLQMIVYVILDDFLFYWTHRLLHIPFMYKYIHKPHHSFKRSNAFAGEYFHPIDYLLSGTLPIVLATFVIRPHILVIWTWLALRIWEACDGHSGLDLIFVPFRYFPFRPGAQVHDFHHSQNVGNYGSMTSMWDWLCGTDLSYKDYLARQSAKVE